MIAYTIEASGPQEMLSVVGMRLGDLTKPITEVLTLGLEDARNEIAAQGVLFAGGWLAMSPMTPIVAMKLYGKSRSPGTLLHDTGGLLESLTPGGPENLFEPGPQAGQAGTSYVSPRSGFPVAVGQQQGTSRTFHVLQGMGFSEPGIPPRPFLGWHEQKGDEYVEIFARSIIDEVAQ